MITRKLLLLSVSVIAILVSSTIFIAIPRAAAQADTGKNSKYPNYDQWATNFNPQTAITKDNVQYLELKWIFPWPQGTALVGFPWADQLIGSEVTPLVIDGILYSRAEDLTVYAIDGRSGKVLWNYRPPIGVVNLTAAQRNLPIGLQRALSSHAHQISYFEGRIYVPWPNCQVLGQNALTGKVEFQLKTPVCANLEGNKGQYKGLQSVGPVFDAKRRMLIYGTSVLESVESGRGAYRGYNVDTGELKWTLYLMPAQCQSDPEWTLRIANKGYIRGIKASTLPREVLLNDWHYQGLAACKGGLSAAGVAMGWGEFAVDEDTGIAYLATAQPSPDYNATYRPGPNALSTSVLAVKTDTGELLWWHQINPHDLLDADCAWNTALAVVNGKKMVFKMCKSAHLYALDAATGEAIWTTDYSPYIKKGANGPQPNYEEPADPRSVADMTKPWLSYPGNQPKWKRTSQESDVTVAYGKVYTGAVNGWSYGQFGPVEPTIKLATGSVSLPAPTTFPTNGTIFAHDAATGKLVWRVELGDARPRGAITVSGGLAWAPAADGTLRAFDAETGKLVYSRFHGVPAPNGPVIAADGDGKMKLFITMGRVGTSGGVPGALLAYGLPDKLPEPQVITKEVVKEVPKEVIKEVPREVIKEVVKEVPKEVIKTVTVETISPVSYAAIGISVVLVVIAGVLFTRRKKA